MKIRFGETTYECDSSSLYISPRCYSRDTSVFSSMNSAPCSTLLRLAIQYINIEPCNALLWMALFALVNWFDFVKNVRIRDIQARAEIFQGVCARPQGHATRTDSIVWICRITSSRFEVSSFPSYSRKWAESRALFAFIKALFDFLTAEDPEWEDLETPEDDMDETRW